MNCPVCGNEISDGLTFCPECGAPLAEIFPDNTPAAAASAMPGEAAPEAAPEKKKSRRLSVLIAGIAAVVLLLILLISRFAVGSPMDLVAKGFSNTAGDMQSGGIFQAIASVAKHGSITLDVDGEQLTKALNKNAINLDGSISVYTNLEDLRLAITAAVKNGSNPLLDAFVWAGKDSIGVSSDVLLDEKAYGVDLTKIKSALPDSIFNPENNTNFGLSDELYNALLNLGDFDGTSKDLARESQDAAEAILSELQKVLKDNFVSNQQTTTLAFNGKDTKVTAVTVTADDDRLSAAVSDLLKWAESSKELKQYLEYFDTQAAKLSDFFEIDSISEYFYELLDEVKDNSELVEDIIDDLKISVTFYLSKSGKKLIGVDINVDYDDDKSSAAMRFGPDPSAPTEIFLSLKGAGEDLSYQYLVNENNSSKYASSLEVQNEGTTVSSYGIEWDKKSGDFSIVSDQFLTFEANLIRKGSTITFVPEKLAVNIGRSAFKLENPGIVLTIDSDAKFPSIPKYIDLLDFEDATLWDLIMSVTNAISTLQDTFSLLS